jgi:hypothetical protein
MSAPAIANPAAASFVERTTMQSILGLDQRALDQVMATAYLLYQGRRYAEVVVLCRGLIAADHTYWWSYSLHAAALRRLGRLEEALAQLDQGLVHEPAEKKLLLMRGEILAAIGRWKDRAPANDLTPAPTSTPASTTSTTSGSALAAAGVSP